MIETMKRCEGNRCSDWEENRLDISSCSLQGNSSGLEVDLNGSGTHIAIMRTHTENSCVGSLPPRARHPFSKDGVRPTNHSHDKALGSLEPDRKEKRSTQEPALMNY